MAAALTYFTVLSIFPRPAGDRLPTGRMPGHGEESAAVIRLPRDNAPAQMYAIMEDPRLPATMAAYSDYNPQCDLVRSLGTPDPSAELSTRRA